MRYSTHTLSRTPITDCIARHAAPGPKRSIYVPGSRNSNGSACLPSRTIKKRCDDVIAAKRDVHDDPQRNGERWDHPNINQRTISAHNARPIGTAIINKVKKSKSLRLRIPQSPCPRLAVSCIQVPCLLGRNIGGGVSNRPVNTRQLVVHRVPVTGREQVSRGICVFTPGLCF